MSNENAQSQIERIRRNNVHKPISKDFFHLIPQSGVHHTIFPEEVTHNAIWDCKVLKNGRVFFTLCAELADAQCVRLYEYLPETASFRLCFRLEEHVFQQERGIRTSKIHTSISEMNDGRLIMTTHTTARSPYHPTWMPRQYYSHQWEGYQGSVVLIYDPNTGSIENRGIPIPRESIYGGVYDPAHHAFFFTGWFRGHLYRLDIDTNEIRDFGQVTEYGSFRLHRGPDGHIYGNSRSGNFYRLNTDKMLLQPLVENAFIHGLESMLDPGMIFVNITLTNGALVIQVRDNGVGIEPERLQQLQASLRMPPQKSGVSIGLFNVHARIWLRYGSSSAMTIDSKPGDGTCSVLHLPLPNQEGEKENVQNSAGR